MTSRTIASGDSETVVQEAATGQDFAVLVKDYPVRFSTSRQYVERGTRFEDGDRAIVHLPPGEELVAYGDGAGQVTLELYPQGVNALGASDDLQFTHLPGKKMTVSGSVDSDVTSRQGRNLGKTRLMDSGNALIDATNPLPTTVEASAAAGLAVEQQTPVGVEDSTGTQVDPAQQPDLGTTFTSIDLNTAATTTVYNPATDAELGGVHMAHGGSTAEVRLEITDGTNTAVLSDPGAGAPIHFSDDLQLDAGESLQIVVEVTEGAALTETAAASGGAL